MVDRIDWLVERCRNRRVIHIGFADDRGLARRRQDGKWLHEHLAGAAADLVGIDSNSAAVAEAVRAGYKAHAADCADPDAVAALGLEPAEIVVAGEVLQSVDRPGPFLKGIQSLCPEGRLIITVHNACGLMFTAGQTLRGIELQDPDHVMTFTWRTLNNLVSRNGWHVIETAVYTSAFSHRRDRSRLELVALRAVLGIERVLGRLGRPFAADGLIVVAEPASPEAAPG